MKHRWMAAVLAMFLCWSVPSSVLFCCAEDELTLTEAYFAGQESDSGWVHVPGKGVMRYYAQNDDLWRALTYEAKSSAKRRPFGDGGCCPTAVAMAIRQLVPDDELCSVMAYGKRTYSLCPCSVNAYKCSKGHARYIPTSNLDFDRFLPLLFADFATGNNVFGAVSRSEAKGTSTSFVHHLIKVYQLDVQVTTDLDAAIDALHQGKAVIAHSSAGAAFTNTGHYVTLAHADEEKLYVLDPMCREEYDTQGGNKIEILQPGLVALRHEDIRYAGLGSFMIFSKSE